MHTLFLRLWLTLAAVVILAAQAQAAPIIFSGSNGRLGASAQFELTNTTVKVTLTNTAGPSAEKLMPADVLTAVFFDLTGGEPLTPLSAVALGGLIPSAGAAPPVGPYWQYKTNLQSAALHWAHSGISSTGLGIFGPTGNFCVTGCQALNGLPYGIVPASYQRGEGNGGVEGSTLISYSAMFTLRGNAENATVSNVWFQYGTSLSEPSFGGSAGGGAVPEPSPALLIGCGLLLVAVSGQVRKRLRRNP